VDVKVFNTTEQSRVDSLVNGGIYDIAPDTGTVEVKETSGTPKADTAEDIDKSCILVHGEATVINKPKIKCIGTVQNY
jgi:hypothetical protein